MKAKIIKIILEIPQEYSVGEACRDAISKSMELNCNVEFLFGKSKYEYIFNDLIASCSQRPPSKKVACS